MMVKRLHKDVYKKIFGFDPVTIGLRYRNHYILEELDETEIYAGAQIGDLCVESRDGADNPYDVDAGKKPNYRGDIEDPGDCTYRYYYFSPLNE